MKKQATPQESEPPKVLALTETVLILYREGYFDQHVQIISAKHAARGYSTLVSDIAWRLREVVNQINEFYWWSVHPVTEFYFKNRYRFAPLKGSLEEGTDSYVAGLECLAVRCKKVAGLRFVKKESDRLQYIWHNELMKSPSGALVSRCNKIVIASANKTLAPTLARELLEKPVKAIRAGINDVKAIPGNVKELKDWLDKLI